MSSAYAWRRFELTVLIVGSGLVGSELARQLVEHGEKPLLADVKLQPEHIGRIAPLDRMELVNLDVVSLPEVLAVVKQKAVEKIVLTAALISFQDRPYYGTLVNCMGTVNVLEAARILDVGRVVFTSSHSVYRTWKSGWQSGDSWDEDSPLEPGNIYAATKAASDMMGLGYNAAYGVDFVSLRYPFIFGPWSGSTGGTATALIQNLLQEALEGKERTVEPSFSAEELIYSKDVGESIVKALLMENLEKRVLNIGMGSSYSFKEIVNTINRIIPGSKLRAVGKPPIKAYKNFALRKAPASIELAEKILGFKPRFDLEEGLKDYAEWCRIHKLL